MKPRGTFCATGFVLTCANFADYGIKYKEFHKSFPFRKNFCRLFKLHKVPPHLDKINKTALYFQETDKCSLLYTGAGDIRKDDRYDYHADEILCHGM